MKYLLSFCLFLFFGFHSYGQADNMTLMSKYDPAGMPSVSGVFYNDVWGYTSGSGQEYALVGTADSIVIIRINDCYNTERVAAFYGGGSAVWRDIKTYGSYAYSVCDGCSEGLKIINMSGIDSGNISVSTSTSFFTRAHNIFIDVPNGRLYACGTNAGNGTDLVVLNIAGAAAANPTLLKNIDFTPPGSTTTMYIHDLYVENNIAYCSHGYTGLYVWDLNDLNNIPTTTKIYDSQGYNHSSWPSSDGNYLFTADELPQGLPLAVVENNTNNLVEKTTFSDPIESSGIPTPHNPFVVGNTLYVSTYEDGLQVWDVSNPLSPSRTAYYDTYPTNNGNGYTGTEGNWGVYPFFGSECLVATDIEFGVHFLKIGIITPVTWKSFDLSLNRNNQTLLTWSTESESNNSHFEVLHSTNGIDFKLISKVDGAINSSDQRNYSTIDRNPYLGINYYKIKQVDLNGEYSFTEIKTLEISPSDDHISLYPNPAKEEFSISIIGQQDQSIVIELYDPVGTLIFTDQMLLKGSNQNNVFNYPLDQKLANGNYTIRLISNDQAFCTQPLVILR